MPDTNTDFDKIRSDFEAAIARETQIRVTYETSLIPDLQRDLQATRLDLVATMAERDALVRWKIRSENALALADRALTLLSEAIAAAPGTDPISLLERNSIG